MGAVDQSAELRALVERNLGRVRRKVAGYRRRHRWISLSIALAGGLATALTGGVAAAGPEVAAQVGGWRLICTLAAVAAGLATVLTGLQERLMLSEHLAKATACAAELSALSFALQTGTADTSDGHNEYKRLLQNYFSYIDG